MLARRRQPDFEAIFRGAVGGNKGQIAGSYIPLLEEQAPLMKDLLYHAFRVKDTMVRHSGWRASDRRGRDPRSITRGRARSRSQGKTRLTSSGR
jgi:hypothetical protein